MATVQQLDKSKPRSKCRKWRLWANGCKPRRSKCFTGTYTEACAAAVAFEAECLESEAAAASAPFMEYARLWHERRAASEQFAPGTMENDRRALRAFARTDLAGLRLAEVTPEACTDALLWLKHHPARGSKPLSGTTANKLHRALYSILEQAEADGRIGQNPMRRQKAPRVDTKERRALAPGQLRAAYGALEALPMDGRAMALRLIIALGLRRGEACGVLVSDLDLGAGVLTVRHAVKERDGSIGAPKSAAAVRPLPLPAELRQSLSDWLSERERRGIGGAPALCCNQSGRTLRPQLLQRWWNENRAALGCDGLTLHELRHSNLSMMARHMPSAFDLQRWAGWSSLEPARVYIHSDLDALAAGVESAFGGSDAQNLHNKQIEAPSDGASTCGFEWSGWRDLNPRPPRRIARRSGLR